MATRGSGDGFVDKPKLFGRGYIYDFMLEELDAKIHNHFLKSTGVDALVVKEKR